MNEKFAVLLVDDDEDDYIITRDLIAEIPGGMYRLDWSRSFEAGLDAWRRGDFHMVLLDYRLGARTGLEFLRVVRESGSQIPVIILTGQGDREVDVEAMTAGATDYVVKSELTATLLDRAMRYAFSMTEMNVRLLEEHKRLLHVEKLSSVGLLAAGVAHEVNNPLAGIKSLVASLRRGELSPEKQVEYFDAIEDGLERMGATIRGLLDFSREQPMLVGEVELADVATACLRLMAASLRNKAISTEVQIPSGERVRGDRSKLMQALLNLLMNACDATPKGGSIVLSTMRSDGKIGLALRDTGAGISKEITSRVLEPFFTTKPPGQGTGLGLAIVSSIAKEHGGSLAIDSTPGSGTTMTLWLPGA